MEVLEDMRRYRDRQRDKVDIFRDTGKPTISEKFVIKRKDSRIGLRFCE